jgi:hypothetical protein
MKERIRKSADGQQEVRVTGFRVARLEDMEQDIFTSENGQKELCITGWRMAYWEDAAYQDMKDSLRNRDPEQDVQRMGHSYRTYTGGPGEFYLVITNDLAYWRADGERGVKGNVSAQWWIFPSNQELLTYLEERTHPGFADCPYANLYREAKEHGIIAWG